MTVYGIIPARKNSRRVPGKNLALLRGKPLIQYTIEAAKQSGVLERIIVSTDCCKTANVAAELGVQVVMRPEALSRGDGVHPSVVVAHCLDSLPKPDAVMWLQPTSPLRNPEWIEQSVSMMRVYECDSVVSFVLCDQWHCDHMARLSNARPFGYSFPEVFRHPEWTNDPHQMPLLLRSGDIYLTKTDVLLSCDLYGNDSRALIIPRERYCNINEPVDLKIAEALL